MKPASLISTAALILALGLPAVPAAAQQVCRPDSLGTVGCLPPVVPPPKPRAAIEPRARGLEAVLEDADPAEIMPDLVPPRRTNSFGQTRLRPGEAGAPRRPCRRGALGTLTCP